MAFLWTGALFILFLQDSATNVHAQATGSSTTVGALICSCEDVPRLLDRMQKLAAIRMLIINKIVNTSTNAPATQQDWAALQTQIRNYLQALQMQNLTQYPETSLFSGNGDPFCGSQMISAGACLDQDFAIHQQMHSASCRAGYWSWQTPWTDRSMIHEELSALQSEIHAIQAAVSLLKCMQAGAGGSGSGSGGGSSNQQSSSGAPAYCKEEDNPDGDTDAEFKLVVQNITTTSVNIPGAVTEMSSRSLNNGQGIQIDIDVHEDGKFDGKGSGQDAGTVAGAAPAETVSGQFGHDQDISASGEINPGTCEGQQCQGDVMHLVLEGAESQQTGQFQARGQLNRNLEQNVSTGSGRIEFDLPAYVGSSAKKVFFDSPMLHSYMTVQIIPGKETPTLPVGTSLLYAEEQCKEAKKLRLGANKNKLTSPKSGSGAGITIPGLTATTMTPPSNGQANSDPAIVIPGLPNLPTKLTPPPNKTNTQPPPSLALKISEAVHLGDSPRLPLSLVVNESIHIADTVQPPVVISIIERVQVSEQSSTH
jgi:hypothetical protein